MYNVSPKACQTSIRPLLLFSDIEKAFLQIKIRELLNLVINLHLNRIEVNGFAGLVFALTKTLFTLKDKLKVHIVNYKSLYPEFIENIRNDMFVDGLVLGRNILSEIKETKQNSIELFTKGRLHN